MAENIDGLLKNFNQNAPAASVAIEAFERQADVKLPVEYVEFLRKTDGGEGFIGKSAYLILWSVGELTPLNQAYEVENYAPRLLIFGSNGGGEAFGFDTRSPQWPVVQMPFVGMQWDLARPMRATFNELLERPYETQGISKIWRQGALGGVDCRGKEILEIMPVILGGSPTDAANKTVLTRADHINAVVYWNNVIKELRDQGEGR